MIVTEKDYKKYLLDADVGYQGQETWRQAFSSVDLNRQRQLNNLTYSYSDAMNEAYKQAYLNEQNILGTSLMGSDKQTLIDENTAALEQAFTTFSQQRAKAVSEVDANANALREQISTSLGERAANFKAYDDAHYDYLVRLYADYGDSELFTGDNSLFSNYMTLDEEAVDEKGNPTGQMRLKTRDELYNPMTDANGEYLSFYDNNGNLTLKGMDFYDKMENFSASYKNSNGNYLSFQDYLTEVNPELAEWATTIDTHNVTGGLNADSFNKVFGQMTDDDRYSFAERFGGLTASELENKFTKFKEYATNYVAGIDKTNHGNKAKKNAKAAENMANELMSLADSLGVREQLESEFKEVVKNSDAITGGGENFLAFLENALISGYPGAIIEMTEKISKGAYGDDGLVSVLKGYGDYIHTLLKNAGPVSSFTKAAVNDVKRRKQNEQYERQLSEAYTNLVNQLALYSEKKRIQTQKQYK